MATFIEIQCDICGVMAQAEGADDSLPPEWYNTETTDHHGGIVESCDLCPSCYESVDSAIDRATAAIIERRNAAASA